MQVLIGGGAAEQEFYAREQRSSATAASGPNGPSRVGTGLLDRLALQVSGGLTPTRRDWMERRAVPARCAWTDPCT